MKSPVAILIMIILFAGNALANSPLASPPPAPVSSPVSISPPPVPNVSVDEKIPVQPQPILQLPNIPGVTAPPALPTTPTTDAKAAPASIPPPPVPNASVDEKIPVQPQPTLQLPNIPGVTAPPALPKTPATDAKAALDDGSVWGSVNKPATSSPPAPLPDPIEVKDAPAPEVKKDLLGNCVDFPDKIKSCALYECKAPYDAKKGDVTRQIVGIIDGQCGYNEIIEGESKKECFLDKDTQSKIASDYFSYIDRVKKGDTQYFVFSNKTTESMTDKCDIIQLKKDSLLPQIPAINPALTGILKRDELKTKESDEAEKIDEQAYNNKQKKQISAIDKLDYKTTTLPPQLFSKEYDRSNKHLPKAVYKQDLANAAFALLNKKEYAKLDAIIKELGTIDIRDNAGDSLLMKAITSNNYDGAKLLVMKGANVNIASNNGVTPLIAAVAFDNNKMVKLLLDFKADINISDVSGKSPLFYAFESGNLQILQQLINAGADINKADNNKMTLLMMAASQGKIDMVDMLLKSGANIDSRNNQAQTALMFAAYSGNRDIVFLLLKKGAALENKDIYGRTAIDFAREGGQNIIAEQLTSITIDKELAKSPKPKDIAEPNELYNAPVENNVLKGIKVRPLEPGEKSPVTRNPKELVE